MVDLLLEPEVMSKGTKGGTKGGTLVRECYKRHWPTFQHKYIFRNFNCPTGE